MAPNIPSSRSSVHRVAFWALVAFLVAVLAALGVTLVSVAPSVEMIAGLVVFPIVAVTLLLLYFERAERRWSFAGAAVLGFVGVTLRLVVNSMPSLEVGRGLPVWVTLLYVGLGGVVVTTNLWSYLAFPRSPIGG